MKDGGSVCLRWWLLALVAACWVWLGEFENQSHKVFEFSWSRTVNWIEGREREVINLIHIQPVELNGTGVRVCSCE